MELFTVSLDEGLRITLLAETDANFIDPQAVIELRGTPNELNAVNSGGFVTYTALHGD